MCAAEAAKLFPGGKHATGGGANTTESTSSSKDGGGGTNKGLAITLPLLFILLLVAGAIGGWFWWNRRRVAAAQVHSKHFQNGLELHGLQNLCRSAASRIASAALPMPAVLPDFQQQHGT